MSYSQANILETDDKTIGALGIGLVFITATAGLLAFVSQNTTIFSDNALSTFIIQFILAFGFLFVLAIFANYKGLDFIQDYAYPIIKWCYLISIGIFVGGLVIGGLFLFASGSIVGIILLGLGALLTFLFIRGWPFIHERIKRAADWLTVSATIVLNEPGMIVLSFIQSVVVGVTVIVEAISLFAWQIYAEQQGISQDLSDGIVYGIMALYLWLSLTVIYYFDGANTFISYARIHNKDPKVGQGLNAASRKIISIVGYALITTIVTIITRLLFFASYNMRAEGRGNKNVGLVILSYFLQILGSIIQLLYHLISFFTLPSIIIRQKSTMAAMSESKSLFTRTFWDMIISDMGYGYGSVILYLVTGLILSVFGFIYGYFLASIYLTLDAVIVGILMAVVALVLGLFASRFFLKPLYTALVTTIYVYATEGPSALKMISEERKHLVSYLDQQSSNPKYLRGTNQRSTF